jgi:hypothetical protein
MARNIVEAPGVEPFGAISEKPRHIADLHRFRAIPAGSGSGVRTIAFRLVPPEVISYGNDVATRGGGGMPAAARAR